MIYELHLNAMVLEILTVVLARYRNEALAAGDSAMLLR